MIFKASNEQLKNICALAVNHSEPQGLGFLHFRNERYFPRDFFVQDNKSICIDFYRGRMVKLHITPVKKNTYEIKDYNFRRQYQSWAKHFRSLAEFLQEAGVTEYEEAVPIAN